MLLFYKYFNIFKIIIVSNVLFFHGTLGQQRGLDGSQNIQIPRRPPVLDYKPQVPISPSYDARSLIQFDHNLHPEYSPQNDPSSTFSDYDYEDNGAIVDKFKLKFKERLEQNRKDMEKVIQDKLHQLESRIKFREDSHAILILDKIAHLNDTLTDLEHDNSNTGITNNIVQDRIDNTNPTPITPPLDNALLHVFSMVNSIDTTQAWMYSPHIWIQKLLEYDTFLSNNPQFQLVNQIGNETKLSPSYVTSSECGGPAITSPSEGIFVFQPDPDFDFSSSGGNCIWRIAPKDAKSIVIKMESDSFIRRGSSANVSLVPQDIDTWAPIMYGKDYRSSTIKKSCDWEWNCHGYDVGPSSTLNRTDRVINILKESAGLKKILHKNYTRHVFTEENVYVILSFDPEKGIPPPFSLKFKGRSCWLFCDEDLTVKEEEGTFLINMFLFIYAAALNFADMYEFFINIY